MVSTAFTILEAHMHSIDSSFQVWKSASLGGQGGAAFADRPNKMWTGNGLKMFAMWVLSLLTLLNSWLIIKTLHLLTY